jgi:GTP cyclohydrolase II
MLSMPENGTNGQQPDVEFVAQASLPTRYGEFTIHGFRERSTGKEHTAVVRGDVSDKERCPVRVHSECHTGDVLGSLRCDCRDQLEASLRHIAGEPHGVVIYLRQEGRGIGLLNKIRAYSMQDLGFDTVEANTYLGLPEDARDYTVAAEIVRALGIRSILLMTNNPDKIDKLLAAGTPVVGRIPLICPPNAHSNRYLRTKRKRMRHML